MLIYKYYAVLLEVPSGHPLVSEITTFEYDNAEDIKHNVDFRPYALIGLVKEDK